jgi:hypothetical protein
MAGELCDPLLKPRSADPLRYMLRGDRCEGRYVADVASSTLRVASLTGVFEEFDPASTRDLVVTWTAPQPGPVRIRALALRPREYYRMDTLRTDGSSVRWPTNILGSLKLGRRDVGIVAWTTLTIGGEDRDVYLPVSIGPRAALPSPRSYHVVLWPGRELTEVYLSLAPVDPAGRGGAYLFEGRPLKRSYYPAERRIDVDLPVSELERPGVYYLEIAATARQAPPITTRSWFFHAGG